MHRQEFAQQKRQEQSRQRPQRDGRHRPRVQVDFDIHLQVSTADRSHRERAKARRRRHRGYFVLFVLFAVFGKKRLLEESGHILQQLRAKGYWAMRMVENAEKWGGNQSRTRMYLVAVLMPAERFIQPPVSEDLGDFFRSLQTGMQQSAGPISEVVFMKYAELQKCMKDKQMPIQAFLKTKQPGSQSCLTWKEEHCTLFRMVGLPWPVDFGPRPSTLVLDDWTYHLGGLCVRGAEMLYFLNHEFEPLEDESTGELFEVEFLDVNPSLGQTAGYKMGDKDISKTRPVWKGQCPTLVASSQIVLRFPSERLVRRMEADKQKNVSNTKRENQTK